MKVGYVMPKTGGAIYNTQASANIVGYTISSIFGKYSLPIIIGGVIVIALAIILIIKHKKDGK